MILPVLIASILIVAAIYGALALTFLHDMRQDHKKSKTITSQENRTQAIEQH
jgi:hypothetical protein